MPAKTRRPFVIRVVNVKGLRGEARAGVCYCGRAFAGWAASPWGNPFRPRVGFDPLAAFRSAFLGRPYADVHRSLSDLWESCEHGAKPLGCWCLDATHGDGQPVECHAQILAELLTEWVTKRLAVSTVGPAGAGQTDASAVEMNGITEAEITVALPPVKPGGKSAGHDGIFGSVSWQWVSGDLVVWLNGKQLNWRIMSRPAFFRLLYALGIEGGAA